MDKDAEVRPGATLRVYADLLPASDGTAPFAIHTFNQITGGDTIDPRQAAVANDHFVFTGKESDDRQTAIGREFAAHARHRRSRTTPTPGDGIFHFYFPEQGLVMPGQFIPGADSHSRAYGAYGAVGIGVGSTTLGFGWSTGYVYFTLAQRAARASHRASCSPGSAARTSCCELLERWGAEQSQGMSVEFVDDDRQLPIAYRNTIANMMAEAEAQNGIFAPDEMTYAWYRDKGMNDLPYPPIRSGRRRRLRDRRDARPVRGRADDRQAVQPRQRLSRRRGGPGADRVRQGLHRLVHQRQLRRPAAGRAGAARRARGRARARAGATS